jgi:hypothetical protein
LPEPFRSYIFLARRECIGLQSGLIGLYNILFKWGCPRLEG